MVYHQSYLPISKLFIVNIVSIRVLIRTHHNILNQPLLYIRVLGRGNQMQLSIHLRHGHLHPGHRSTIMIQRSWIHLRRERAVRRPVFPVVHCSKTWFLLDGDVLDPFLIRVVRADVMLNPLISPRSDRVHLNWNMLFPTSTVQSSTDPSHISWSKGRDAPATFPRISSLRLVSDTIPWVLNVEAKDIGIGVTCGEVIDSIGQQLLKCIDEHDYERLTLSLRQEVDNAYRRNRSREPGVPGDQLGQEMKRLDFLKQDTMFAGIEVNDRVVKRVCGDFFPCVFVLKCSTWRGRKSKIGMLGCGRTVGRDRGLAPLHGLMSTLLRQRVLMMMICIYNHLFSCFCDVFFLLFSGILWPSVDLPTIRTEATPISNNDMSHT